jgi:dephospho-CoA kinase
MALKIGITGGIGSGKTTVSKVFEVLGIPVYYADLEAKRLMNEDEKLMEKIQYHFGKECYLNGRLNRKYLSDLVFNNENKLLLLNSIVHPATLEDAEIWMQKQTAPYVLKEAALIFESGSQQQLDYVIGVFTPTPLRIQRVINRDQLTREEVKSRMDKQIDETIKMRLCDFVINNNEQELVIPQVIKIHETLLSKVELS